MAELSTRPFNSSTASRAGALDEGLRSFMLGTYNYMALGVAGTAIVTLLLVSNPSALAAVASLKWGIFFATLGLGWFAPRLIQGGSAVVAHGAYWAYCALWGALIAPMVYVFVSKGAVGLVSQAFFISAATFATASVIGYTTKKDMTGWSGFLSMASIGLLLTSLVSFFFITDPGTSTTVSFVISAVVVLLFSVMTAWETQAIKSMYLHEASHGNEASLKRSSIFGAFMLYGSFVTLFVHILNMLGIMNNEN